MKRSMVYASLFAVRSRPTELCLKPLSAIIKTCILCNRSYPSNTAMPNISVSKPSALQDEKITIRVTGLADSQLITIKASFTEGSMEFASFGWYSANNDGIVDISKNKCIYGTYTDLDSMGLFWSMKPAPNTPPASRFFKKDVTSPTNVELAVFDGHLPWEQLFDKTSSPLAKSLIQRWCKAHDVRREIVREGNVRGSLYIPPGPGPFPAVIDVFGSGGGLMEHRASLLASRGFLTLCLAFFEYEDLPADYGSITVDYFIESTNWFSSLPMVKNNKIGFVGLSKGAELAMITALYCPQISAIVNINGMPFISTANLFNSLVPGGVMPAVEINFQHVEIENGSIIFKDCYFPEDKDFTKIWNSNVYMLTMVGEDDHCFSPKYNRQFHDLVPENAKHRFEFVFYPKTGHLIEPPYKPFCSTSYHKMLKMNMKWGGSPREHASAEEDAWEKTLSFLSYHLNNNSNMYCKL